MIYQIHQQDAELRGREIGREEGISIGEERGEKRGIVIGEERGEKRGISIGVKQEKINSAYKMLSRKMPLDVISELTGLPISEINKLKVAPSAN